MLHEKILEQINHHLGDVLKNTPLNDIEKNIKAIVLALFNKLDLVTREEFDTQQKVLLATRIKLEELETIIKELSKKLEE